MTSSYSSRGAAAPEAAKLDPRAGDEEAVRDVCKALVDILTERKRKQENCNLQDSNDDEDGGSGTGACLFSLLDPTFTLLPFAHTLPFPCLFSV